MTCFLKPVDRLFQRLQPLPLEKEHIKHSNGNGRVSEVEDWAEKDEMPIGAEEEFGQPGGIFAGHVDDGEIEHVDHAAVQPARIAAPVGEERRHLREGALAEDAPVEHAVDDVAHGACRDEGEAKQHAELGAFLRLADQNPEQGDDGHNAEEAQGQLKEAAATQPTEGHAVVFDKQQPEPTPDNGGVLSESHTGLDPNLEDLVEEQDEKNHHKRPDEAAAAFFFHFFFSLASRQRVVMGTQRSLSLGMSRPVSQQTP